MAIHFGTDGWRAVISEEFTFENVRLVAQAIAEQVIADIVNIVMQMKSNGSMFHFQLVSMTSDVMLRFLENVRKLDEDFLDIFAVYIKVIDIILNKKLTGNGGREGYVLTQELHSACLRYYTKYAIPH